MRFEDHCRRCQELLGNEWYEVHHWLDALAAKPEHERDAWKTQDFGHVGPLNPHHRKHRHHLEGIEFVYKTWGPEAAQAAELHILDDRFGPCPHTPAQVEQIPLNERDYVEKGWL
jgi:hypothetical protein